MAAAPIYLDDSGNPTAAPVAPAQPSVQPAQASPVYLDDSGNPTGNTPPQAQIAADSQKYGSIGPQAPVGNDPGEIFRAKVREAENLTQQGRQEHPIEAAIGDFLNKFYRPAPEPSKNQPLGKGLLPPELALGDAIPIEAGETAAETAAPIAARETINPIEDTTGNAAAKIAAKANVPVGSPATIAPTGEDIQPALQQGIRNSVNQAAANNGFDAIPDSVSIRNVPKALGDQAYARSKATFDAAEKVTGIDFTVLKNNISKLDDQISDLAITDPEKAGQLAQQKLAYETQAENGLQLAQSKGVNVAQARADWNTQLRADELSNHVRNSAEGTQSNPIINPTKLTPRLQKMNEAEVGQTTPKLTQLLGDDAANRLVSHSENARDALTGIKNFSPVPAKDQVALQELIAPNVKAGKVYGTNVDWKKTLDDFDAMSTAEQRARFTDPSEVRAALRSKATASAAWSAATKAAYGVGGLLSGAEIWNLLREHLWQ